MCVDCANFASRIWLYANYQHKISPTFSPSFFIHSVSTLEPACKVHGCKVFLDARSIFGWSQSKSAVLGYNPDVRSARLYGKFSLDKTLTLQAGATVCRSLPRCPPTHLFFWRDASSIRCIRSPSTIHRRRVAVLVGLARPQVGRSVDRVSVPRSSSSDRNDTRRPKNGPRSQSTRRCIVILPSFDGISSVSTTYLDFINPTSIKGR